MYMYLAYNTACFFYLQYISNEYVSTYCWEHNTGMLCYTGCRRLYKNITVSRINVCIQTLILYILHMTTAVYKLVTYLHYCLHKHSCVPNIPNSGRDPNDILRLKIMYYLYIYPLEPSYNYVPHALKTNNYIQCIYVFCIILTINNDYFLINPLKLKLV
jgi:hypothetical protein